jgi:hypothetical protein
MELIEKIFRFKGFHIEDKGSVIGIMEKKVKKFT